MLSRPCWFCVHKMNDDTLHPSETHFSCSAYMRTHNYECDDPQRLLENHILQHGLEVVEHALPCTTLENVRPHLVKYIFDCLCHFNDFGMEITEAQRLCKENELSAEEMGCVSCALFLDLEFPDNPRLVCVWPNSEVGHAYEEGNESHICDPPRIQELLTGKPL